MNFLLNFLTFDRSKTNSNNVRYNKKITLPHWNYNDIFAEMFIFEYT